VHRRTCCISNIALIAVGCTCGEARHSKSGLSRGCYLTPLHERCSHCSMAPLKRDASAGLPTIFTGILSLIARCAGGASAIVSGGPRRAHARPGVPVPEFVLRAEAVQLVLGAAGDMGAWGHGGMGAWQQRQNRRTSLSLEMHRCSWQQALRPGQWPRQATSCVAAWATHGWQAE
jgi:hypothetical protein